MARTGGTKLKKSINQRFSDVVDIWVGALQERGVKLPCESPATAVKIRHRLNQYRKAIRDDDLEGFTDLDSFIIQIDGRWVIILPRPTFDLRNARTLDGRPVVPPEWQPGDPIPDRDTTLIPALDAKGIEMRDQFLEAHPEYRELAHQTELQQKKLKEANEPPIPRAANPNEHKSLFGNDDDSIIKK